MKMNYLEFLIEWNPVDRHGIVGNNDRAASPTKTASTPGKENGFEMYKDGFIYWYNNLSKFFAVKSALGIKTIKINGNIETSLTEIKAKISGADKNKSKVSVKNDVLEFSLK